MFQRGWWWWYGTYEDKEGGDSGGEGGGGVEGGYYKEGILGCIMNLNGLEAYISCVVAELGGFLG